MIDCDDFEKCETCDKKVEKNFEHLFHFDHINVEDKYECVSRLRNWNEIEKEIEKCCLLCANCHGIHTANQIASGMFKNLNRDKQKNRFI